MDLTTQFLSPENPSLKICGVTSLEDAKQLVALNVPALGINFWPASKRYCPSNLVTEILQSTANQILRVGVFVNNAAELAPALLADNLLDLVQLHGEEPESALESLLARGVPTIRSLALTPNTDLDTIAEHYLALAETASAPFALLLDTHAPGTYGGTGQTIDWNQASHFIDAAEGLPVILAGGLKPENASVAASTTGAVAIDVASGAESSPGIKDFSKVQALLSTLSP
ncbi:MAG: phosphoribosylanthranilate isomerase [Verrucomicrobiota bacterium]